MTPINDHAAQTAQALGTVLADTFCLYVKVHGFHWNVSGPRFRVMHQMFEEQYNELWQALDPIAERIRALGQMAPGSLADMAALGSLPEAKGVPGARAMMQAALDGHLAVAAGAKAALSIAERAADPATADLLTQRIASHEKTAWMLRAMLSEEAPAS